MSPKNDVWKRCVGWIAEARPVTRIPIRQVHPRSTLTGEIHDPNQDIHCA